MIVDKKYLIKESEWANWSDTLANAIKDFYDIFKLYPNILQANDYTFSQFDFLTNVDSDERQRVLHEDDITGKTRLPDKTEEIILNSFNYCEKADLDFAVDNQLANKEFRLIYDDEPEWDEKVPVDCPESEFETSFV